jgi:hypothetical protein
MTKIEHNLGWHYPDLSDFEFRLKIDFEPFRVEPRRNSKSKPYTVSPVFSWKRAWHVVMIKGKHTIGLSPQAKKWAKKACEQIGLQWSMVFKEPIPKEILLNAAIVSYLPSARLIDASNLYQGPEDIMSSHNALCQKRKDGKPKTCEKHAGVYVDDSQIVTHNGSDRLIDSTYPRVEITLTPYAPGRCKRHPVQQEMEF